MSQLRFADAEAWDLSDMVDTDRYPLHQPDSPVLQAEIARCRAELEEFGCCLLPGFLRPEALAEATRDSRSLAPMAYFSNSYTNPYFTADDPSLPEDHPRRTFMERSSGFVTRDQIPPTSPIHRLYVARAMKALVEACLGEEKIYEYADPFAGLVINVLPDGTQQPWHYDTNEFIVSMMTQKAEKGGEFEYSPMIRSPEGENYDGVREVLLDRDRSSVRVLDLCPGDLQIFKGRFSLHRVARVHGPTERHTAIFAYSQKPGVIGRVERTRQLYGRVSEQHITSEAAPTRADSLVD